MSHTMKLQGEDNWTPLKGSDQRHWNQFGFMSGRSIIEAIFVQRQLMERYMEQKKDLHMIFIDHEKAHDKVTWNVMW
jgi:predicted O-methyltransferase YrrM